MKKFYQIMTKVMALLLIAMMPVFAFAQGADTTKKMKETKAPSHNYWAIQAFGGVAQFNGDLSENLLFNLGTNKWGYNYGLAVTKHFNRTFGLRLRFAHGKLMSETENKFVDTTFISHYFHAYPWETDLQLTINWVNLFWGCKPERLFSSYLIGGFGIDQTIGHVEDINDGNKHIKWIGQPDKANNIGNTDGLADHDLMWKASAGIGLDINIHKNWSLNPEFIWRVRGDDLLDMTEGGAKSVKDDMYSTLTLGLTYKFGYGKSTCCLQEMEKDYALVKYETTPAVLVEKGDSVQATVKISFPEKYFCPTAVMNWQPVVKYEGGQVALKPVTFIGEKITGDGTMIKYKEGGSYSYTVVFPYKPELNNSEMVVAPLIYEPKGKVVLKNEDIKVKSKYADLPSQLLAPGVIYTPTRAQMDQKGLIAEHGYVKEVIVSKAAAIYFKKNKFDLDLKFGINKTDEAKNAMTELQGFLSQGWKLKSVEIDGWASPEGEETFNAGLSENRAKNAHKYMIDWYKEQVKIANKDNKDKKAVRAMVDSAGRDVNFVLNHHGPDWNGFIATLQASNIKDKSKILTVINSTADNARKEQEIRNMILIYPEIEENMLPPLRRAIIKANAYEPRLTDQEISNLAVTSPEKLKVEEILYAGTLTTDSKTKLTIYDNAAKIYGDNWKALNNAGVANINEGNFDKALALLKKAAEKSPNTGIIENNLGVAYAKTGDLKKAEEQFKKAQQLGENTNYNQGVLMIPKGDYAKANSLLANATCTYNLGLAQLVSGNISGAETTLKCAPQDPNTFYLLAIIGAKKADTKMLYEYLMKAVADEDLKVQARTDREFYTYSKTPEFVNIVK